MQVDEATVHRIARLARIKVTAEEAKALEKELSGILDWVKQLDEVDATNVEPMTSVTPMTLKKRTDAVTDGGIADEIVANAPAREDLEQRLDRGAALERLAKRRLGVVHLRGVEERVAQAVDARRELARGAVPVGQRPRLILVRREQIESAVLAAALRHARGAAGALVGNAAEYVTEESRDVVPREELNAFHDDVDALRDDVERLAVRVGRLRARSGGPA